MTTNDYLFTFELTEGMDELDIHIDEEGLKHLYNILRRMKGSRSHESLLSEEFAGNDLSKHQQSENSVLINKVTIHKW